MDGVATTKFSERNYLKQRELNLLLLREKIDIDRGFHKSSVLGKISIDTLEKKKERRHGTPVIRPSIREKGAINRRDKADATCVEAL